MSPFARLALVLAGVGLAAARAGASIPIDLEARSRAGITHVCVDVEPYASSYVLCEDQVGGDGEYSGSECTAAGLPAVCTIDFVPKLRLKGKLVLLQDDQAKDPLGVPLIATGVILEVGVRGKKVELIELFDGNEIGHWNDFAEAFLLDVAGSIQFTNATESAFNFASDNLEDIGLELRAAAQEAWPTIDLSNAVALLTSVVRESPKKSVDHSDPADPLGSSASFKVVIEFARVRP